MKTANRLASIPTFTVWQEMTTLANKHKAVNLGQGFPSCAPPQFLMDELQKTIEKGTMVPIEHQYARIQGDLELVAEIKQIYANRFSKQDLTDENVLITNGTTQGLNVAFQALINPGDEVIIFEPFYDAYPEDIKLAGGVVKVIPLLPGAKNHSDAWCFSEKDLILSITPKTKIILLNTPQNVPGKVWSQKELEIVARIAIERDLIVIMDEVYMSLVYESSHYHLALIPGMWERTITLCSIGKTFSCTGWKIGWAVGPANLVAALGKIVTYQSFSVATPLQKAVARALRLAEDNGYYTTLVAEYKERRKLLCDVLLKNNLSPVPCSGGYFVLADISKVDPKHYYDPTDTNFARDWQFCRWLTKTIGVCAIPLTAFCFPEHRKMYDSYVRFAFCKSEAEIQEAGVRLQKLREYCLL